jgi:hypothetical protein
VVAIGEARTLLVGKEPVCVPSVREDLDDVWDADFSEMGTRPAGLALITLSAGNPMRVVLMTC